MERLDEYLTKDSDKLIIKSNDCIIYTVNSGSTSFEYYCFPKNSLVRFIDESKKYEYYSNEEDHKWIPLVSIFDEVLNSNPKTYEDYFGIGYDKLNNDFFINNITNDYIRQLLSLNKAETIEKGSIKDFISRLNLKNSEIRKK